MIKILYSRMLPLQLIIVLSLAAAISIQTTYSETLDDLTLTCSEEQVDSCPVGLFCEEGRCECGRYPQDLVICNECSPSILNFICATYDEEKKVIEIGGCVYNAGKMSKATLYAPLPSNTSDLSAKCDFFNRKGTLCGRCQLDHHPQAYSYNMTCVGCTSIGWNWARYVMAAYLPLTVFYFIILFFKINVTSSRLLAVVLYCQNMATPTLVRTVLSYLSSESNSFITSVKFLFSIYGIWNLDFFRPFYSDICLGIGVLPTLALDYVIALYPFLLMIITYLLIVLYDKNYKVIRFLWRPFQAVFSLFKDNWNIKTSVIDAFATFFLLSNMKFLSVSFDLLIPAPLYELHRDFHTSSLRLYYAADIHYFGSKHRPYAILALVMLSVFGILPIIILAFYSFAFFQRLLNRFAFRWYILHTFMDAFQGCYKNGTEPGTRDCRWFSSTYFLIRFFLFALTSIVFNPAVTILSVLVIILYSIMIAAIEPFKNSNYNRIFTELSALFCILLLASFLSAGFMHRLFYPFASLTFIVGTVPLLLAIVIVVRWLLRNRRGFSLKLHRIKAWKT